MSPARARCPALPPVAISHYSLVNSLGAGAQAVLHALRHGTSGLAPCDFDSVDIETFVGRVPGIESVPVRADLAHYDCRNNRLAQMALECDGFDAAARRARARYGAARIGVFLGTSTSGILETELAYRRRDPATGALPADFRYAETHNTASLGAFVRRYFDLCGPGYVVSAACASTAKVFGTAMRMMAAGVCDAAIVGGVDTLCLTTLYGFHALELVSRHPCRPFDAARDGISLGEGAGFALLERADAAEAKVSVLAAGESGDAHHMSTPHPEGLGAQLAMRRALNAAGLVPQDIDYINLHGTGTRTNDAAEDRAVCEVFGTATPANSIKGATGHLLGAAGITEAIVCTLALEHGFIPGSPHTQRVDPGLGCKYEAAAHDAPLRRVISNSFGFGGANCCLVLGRGS